MKSASMVFQTLFSGPSPGIVAVVLILAIVAAGAVFWSIHSLLVDARTDTACDNFSSLLVAEPLINDADGNDQKR
jgi:hypothetical protein